MKMSHLGPNGLGCLTLYTMSGFESLYLFSWTTQNELWYFRGFVCMCVCLSKTIFILFCLSFPFENIKRERMWCWIGGGKSLRSLGRENHDQNIFYETIFSTSEIYIIQHLKMFLVF